MSADEASDEREAKERSGKRHGPDDYRAVGHFDLPALVEHEGEHYPCRLFGSVVACSADQGTGERFWAAEAIGLPPGLAGSVTVSLPDGASIPAHLTAEGGLSGSGVPWPVDGDPAGGEPASE